jgi:hypothetical protein
MADAGAVLITGPANAKNELVTSRRMSPTWRKRSSEKLSTIGARQLIAHGRTYLKAADRMRPQKR